MNTTEKLTVKEALKGFAGSIFGFMLGFVGLANLMMFLFIGWSPVYGIASLVAVGIAVGIYFIMHLVERR